MAISASPVQDVFHTSELVEQILLALFGSTLFPLDDMRSMRASKEYAESMRQVARMSAIDRRFHSVIAGSTKLQRKMYLLADHEKWRSWTCEPRLPHPFRPHEFIFGQEPRSDRPLPPLLNPLIEQILPRVPVRFWDNPDHVFGGKLHAFMMINRSEVEVYFRKYGEQKNTISRMFITQPPSTRFTCTIFQDRENPPKLSENVMSCDTGLTVSYVFNWLRDTYERRHDVTNIKLVDCPASH